MKPERPTTRTLAALGQTAGEVAHDFDNALTAIVSHATLIRAHAVDEDARAHAAAILRAARTASRVVDRVRAMLRRRSVRTDVVQVELCAVVDEAWAALEARARRRAIALVRDDRARPLVAGDPADLLQLVLNLGNNAVDASPEGGEVTFIVEIVAESAEAVLRITDRGPGIPERLRELVLEPFFTTKGEAGTGLGLPLAVAIAERHGGTVRLLDGEGGGTVAEVRLPLAPPGTPRPRHATSVVIEGVAADARVLLVDDDPHAREALGLLLEATGLDVDAVADGASALRRFSERRPDVVISDLDLGGEDGADLIAHLSALDATVPIVVCSGATDDTLGPVRRRVAAVFRKPVSPNTLLGAVRRLAAESRALRLHRATEGGGPP